MNPPAVPADRTPIRTAPKPTLKAASWVALKPRSTPPRSRRPKVYVGASLSALLMTDLLIHRTNSMGSDRAPADQDRVPTGPLSFSQPSQGCGARLRGSCRQL